MNRETESFLPASSISFWKKVKPYFNSKERNCGERIFLVEDSEVISNEDDLVVIFNNHFNRITDNLGISVILELSVIDLDHVSSAIAKYATQSIYSSYQIKISTKHTI